MYGVTQGRPVHLVRGTNTGCITTYNINYKAKNIVENHGCIYMVVHNLWFFITAPMVLQLF